MPPKGTKKRKVDVPAPVVVDENADGVDAVDDEGRSGGRKVAGKKWTQAQINANSEAVHAAMANGKKPPSTPLKKPPSTHRELAALVDKFDVVEKADFGKHVSIPTNMMVEPTLLLCTLCATNNHHKWKSTHDIHKLREHLAQCHPSKSAAPASKEGLTDTSTGLRNALVRAILRAGLSVHAAVSLFEELLPYMTNEKAEVPMEVTADKLKSLIDQYLSAQENNMKEVFASQTHMSLSFDGGTSEIFGLHLVVTIVYCKSRKYCLPVHYKSKGGTLAGADLARILVNSLKAFDITLDKVRFIVMDGADYNFTGVDGIHEMVQVVDAISKGNDVPAELSDVDFSQPAPWLGVLTDALTEGFAGIPIIRCRGHYTKTKLDHAIQGVEWPKTSAALFAKYVCNSLYNATARKTRLLAFVRGKVKDNQAADKVSELTLEQLCKSNCTYVETGDPTIDEIQALLEAIGEKAALLENGTIAFANARARIMHSGDSCATFLIEVPKLLEELKSTLQRFKKVQAPLALKNNTRWHRSVYKCYIFCLTHLEDITEFYLAEAAAGLSMPDSAKKLLDLCNTAEKVTELYTQLHEYVEVLSATACYMNYVCEYSSGRPDASRSRSSFGNKNANEKSFRLPFRA